MKKTTINSRKSSCFVLVVAVAVLMSGLSAKGALQIEKAYCGAKGAWTDVTAFLQSELQGDTLSASISQPFDEIGGDPAPVQSKSLLIDYRLDGKPFRLLLDEQYPVAFTINLPAPDAAPPGADSRAAELAAEAALRAKAMPPPRVHLDSPPGNWERYKEYLPLFASLVAIIFSLIAILCAGAAFFQIRQVKKQQPKA